MRIPGWPLLALISMLCTTTGPAHADSIDDLIAKRMKERNIPGLSLAIVQDGKIIKAQGYGFTDKSGKTAVTTETLFQAASISKPVAAAGVLRLVEQGRLGLDADVNTELHAWKLPGNEFTKEKKVTLRGILSHTAGINVHGFPGYPLGKPLPTLHQVLNGLKPANTPAIRVEEPPDLAERYSGGGYTVMQQVVLDTTSQPFPKFLHDTVLVPFGMNSSTYEQPLPQRLASLAATGHFADGTAVVGRYHIYPEMAAAGLWTTASDLARYAIGIQMALGGKANPVISQAMARQMVTRQKINNGLGLFLKGDGDSLWFLHDGRNEGFDCLMTATAATGQGAVVMINANDNNGVTQEVIDAVAKEYHWP